MQAILKFKFDNPDLIKKSLEPDTKNNSNKEVNVNINTDKKYLIIKIESEKISYLKAVINSYLSLIKMLNEMEG